MPIDPNTLLNILAIRIPEELTWIIMPAFFMLIIRELVRKGIALRKSSRSNQLRRFIPILILNTFGILPILYLIFGQKKPK